MLSRVACHGIVSHCIEVKPRVLLNKETNSLVLFYVEGVEALCVRVRGA